MIDQRVEDYNGSDRACESFQCKSPAVKKVIGDGAAVYVCALHLDDKHFRQKPLKRYIMAGTIVVVLLSIGYMAFRFYSEIAECGSYQC